MEHGFIIISSLDFIFSTQKYNLTFLNKKPKPTFYFLSEQDYADLFKTYIK